MQQLFKVVSLDDAEFEVLKATWSGERRQEFREVVIDGMRFVRTESAPVLLRRRQMLKNSIATLEDAVDFLKFSENFLCWTMTMLHIRTSGKARGTEYDALSVCLDVGSVSFDPKNPSRLFTLLRSKKGNKSSREDLPVCRILDQNTSFALAMMMNVIRPIELDLTDVNSQFHLPQRYPLAKLNMMDFGGFEERCTRILEAWIGSNLRELLGAGICGFQGFRHFESYITTRMLNEPFVKNRWGDQIHAAKPYEGSVSGGQSFGHSRKTEVSNYGNHLGTIAASKDFFTNGVASAMYHEKELDFKLHSQVWGVADYSSAPVLLPDEPIVREISE